MFNLLDAYTADWIVSSFPIIRIVLVCIIALCSLTLIVTTLMQSNSNDNSSQALSGGSRESYYAQNKGESRDGKLVQKVCKS